MMQIVFHENFKNSDYASNSASIPDRMESIIEVLIKDKQYKIITPEPASYQDISLAHSRDYIEEIKKKSKLFNMASLSAGGALLSAKIALKDQPAFACIRPPGHHASKDSAWGYCVFCNIGIALLKLKEDRFINSAFLLDFDAHTGDGNINVLSSWKEAKILNPYADNNKDYLKIIEETTADIQHVDIVAVSAGFDSYEKDVGKKLKTFDFYQIGKILNKFTKRMGHKRRFAILEGGYYLPDLGKNVLAFCQGFESSGLKL